MVHGDQCLGLVQVRGDQCLGLAQVRGDQCLGLAQCIIVAAVLAVANAGYLGSPAISYAAPAYASAAYAPAAITSQHSNILRTPGNLGQVSTYSKTIDTPYSSVSKSDVRVSNDALAYGAVPAYAPAIHGAYAAPAIHGAYAAPAIHGAYAAPAIHGAYAAPPIHGAYAAPAIHGAYAAPAIHGAYAAPVVKTTATAVSGHGLLGVAYSAAPVVSHMTYSNAYGLHYAY